MGLEGLEGVGEAEGGGEERQLVWGVMMWSWKRVSMMLSSNRESSSLRKMSRPLHALMGYVSVCRGRGSSPEVSMAGDMKGEGGEDEGDMEEGESLDRSGSR